MIDKSVFVTGIVDNYDERLLEGRLTAEGNICGCILSNLELYDESGLEATDFVTTHGRLLFAIARQLREKGFTQCDEITYLSTVSDKIKSIVDDTFGGFRQINNVIQTVSIKNWDAFLDKLNKMNTLMNLKQKGFNIFEKIILDNGKEIVPFDYFQQLTCNEVLEFYDGTIASMQARTHNTEIVEEGYIDFDEAWIQRVRNKEEMGVSYGEAGYDIDGDEIKTFPFMSANTLGLKPGTLSGWAAHSGCGKAIPNHTLIPTPNGYKKVGDIKPGDYLFGQNGKPTKVLMVHPQQEQKEIWKITFKDGRVAECCKDHLWEYRYRTHHAYAYRTETIEQIYNRVGGVFHRKNDGYFVDIKINGAVEYPEKKLSVDPYVLGVMLGDASLSLNHFSISSGDSEIPELVAKKLGDIVCIKEKSKNYSYYFKYNSTDKDRIKTKDILKDYPELIGTHSYDKFIPKDYLTASKEQRLALLQGLLDTDGTISKDKGRVSFCTTSHKLKDDIVELCRSLGYIATVRVDKREKYKSGACYSIGILTSKEEKQNLFRVGEKLRRAIEYSNSTGRSETNDHLAIVNVEKTGIMTDMTCFTVEAEDHLFLMNDYIVTHNTTYMVTLAMSLASKGEKVVIVTNESDLSDLKTLFLIWVLSRVLKYNKMTKRRFLSGHFTAEDEEMLLKARKYWREHYAKSIKIEVLPDANAAVSCQLIKKAILREGYSAFMVDTMKMTTEDMGDSVWVSLVKDVRALTEIALKYKVIGIITVQLSLGTQNRSWLDSSCLANCKQIKETLSNLILFRKLYPPELDPESPFFIQPFRRKYKNDGTDEWYDEPYQADPEKTWIVAFSDKTRRGIDSGVDGTAFLCRTDLDHASFFETARCRPTRKLFSVEDRRG